MSDLTSGRREACNTISGIKKLYLMDFVQYDTRSFGGFNSATLSSFPTTLIFELEGRNKRADENLNDGVYEQEIVLNMKKQDLPTTQLISLLSNKRVRVIAEYNNDLIKIYGLQNGLDTDVEIVSGTGKGDLNGYQITMKGMEKYQSHFINDLAGTGFFTEGLAFGCLLASSTRPTSINDLVSSCYILQA